jgi:hypothetical protein
MGDVQPAAMTFNKDEVDKVFTVDIQQLLETKEMEIFRKRSKSIPAWNVLLDSKSMTCQTILQLQSSVIELSGARGSFGENSLITSRSENVVRIWGLSGYILGEFLKQIVLGGEEEKAML